MKHYLFSKFLMLVAVAIGLVSCAQSYSTSDSDNIVDLQLLNSDSDSEFSKLRQIEFSQQKSKAQKFLELNKNYNQDLVFMIDMKQPSGNYRFFVHSFKKDSVIESGLVAHGSGSVIYGSDSLTFSNTPDSYQSSLGNYRIGKTYVGNFGKSYKLHGLDDSNSKAYQRYVVLHPYSAVPDEEQEFPIMESLGCPMVSENFAKKLYKIIDSSAKSILMVIYY